jgi:dihydrofolate synthase/folylpolyglutamate synthase
VDLAEAEAWIDGLINRERGQAVGPPDAARVSLRPVRELLEAVGRPQDGLRILHVAGSKGKGSTALLAEALLRGAGLRTGVFTSPHLASWAERFRIDGRDVEGAALARALTQLRPIVDAQRGGDEPASFFDATTAAGLLLFAEAATDVAILEVGLGGRLDSTNVVRPAVTCITSIELEHTDKLGTTHAAIAGEKAGIAKPGIPLVVGPVPDEAAHVIAARAREVGAPLVRLGHEIAFDAEDGRVRITDGDFSLDSTVGPRGRHQAVNAALAIACVRRLGVLADATLHAAAPRALGGASLAGRAELVGEHPWRIVDGAHTEASALALAEVLAKLPRQRMHLVLSISAGKGVDAVCRALAPLADVVTVTRAEPTRSLSTEELAGVVRAVAPRAELRVVEDPQRAVRTALEACAPDDLVCATGSIYLAGIARPIWIGPPA